MKKNEVEKEEKLSMTRELKFKELQDRIDEEEADKIVEEAIKKSKKKITKQELTSELEQEIDELLEVEKKKSPKRRIIEEDTSDDVKITKVNTEEDLYLTSSFKPFKKRLKASKIFKFFFKLIFTIGLFVAFIYFVIMPLYKMLESSKPKVIFDRTLDYVQEQAFTFLDNNFFESNSDLNSMELIVDFDSNIKEMGVLTNHNFIYTLGLDYKKNVFETGYYVENKDKVRHGYSYIEKNNTLYSKMTTSDIYLNEGISDSDYNEFDDLYLKIDDYKYIISTIVGAIKTSYDEEDLVASKEELEIDGITTDVVRNSLELDKNKIIEMDKCINGLLLKNQRFLEMVASLSGLTVEEVEDSLKEEITIEDDYVISINIYTTKGNKFVGFDIEEDGFRNYYFYKYDNKFVAHANLSSDDECSTGGDCVASARFVLDLIGTIKGNETKVDVLLNDEDIGSMNINELSINKIDLDYSFIIQDMRFQGDFLYDVDVKNKIDNIDFSLEFLEQYFRVDVEATYDTMDTIGYVDETKIQKYTDSLDEDIINEFYETTDKLDMSDAYDVYLEFLDSLGIFNDDEEQSSLTA